MAWVLREDQGASGERVLEVAHTAERVLATFDKDFGDLLLHRGAEAAAGVILLHIRAQSPGFITDVPRTSLQSDRVWEGHFSVATESRVRGVAEEVDSIQQFALFGGGEFGYACVHWDGLSP